MVGLAERLGLTAPILLAPMAGAGGAALAIGAMEGGALGSLPCALISPERVRADVAAVRAGAAGPINLNFFCHRLGEADDSAWRAALAPLYAEFGVGPPAADPPLRAPFDARMCEVVEELRPEVVSFHFGLPDKALVERVRSTGALVLSSATSIDEARWLADHGCDAIIAQGYEAGGHAGRFLDGDPAEQMGLMALLPQVVDAVDVPVVAAGGIADGRGVAAALMLGAQAVQIGSAYLHCPESLISEVHRAGLRGEAAERTVFTNLLTGRLARGLRTRLVRELGPVNAAAPPFPHAASALAELRRASEADFGPQWSGQAARLGVALPASELTRKLAEDARALLLRGAEPILPT